MSFTSGNHKSYAKLAQIYNAIRNSFSLQHTVKIIEKEGDINCEFPSSSYITISEPILAGGTALHIALNYYNNEVVEVLLHAGADYTIKNNNGLSALHYIADLDFHSLSNCEKLRKKPFIDAILSEHVTSKNAINPRNNDGLSHLHIACMINHTAAVELFLSNGEDVNQTVNINATCNSGYTPLHFAVRSYETETVRILLKYGANVVLKDTKGMTPMDLLLERKMQIYNSTFGMNNELNSLEQEEIKINEDITNLLLEQISSDSLILDDKGLFRFHIACTLQDTSIQDGMLENVDNMENTISENSRMWPGYTGLHFAAHCNVNTVKLLLARGANLNIKDARGVTPFDICLERFTMRDIHIILSEQQEWKTILLSDGKTKLLDLIFAMGNSNRLKSLLQSSLMYINAYIPKNSQLWPGYTPLHLAVIFSERHKKNISRDYPSEPDLDLVEECLADGADVTIKDSRDWTPLNLAYRQNKMRIVSLLLHCHHLLINPVDEDNLSHLHIACEAQNEILVENLLLRTGDVNIVYKGNIPVRSIKPGYTPLHIAVVKKNLKMVEILMRHGADINTIDFNGCTPIHETFFLTDNNSIAKLLFSSPALRESVVNGVGLSYLHIASKNDDVDVVQRLLQLGAEIDTAIFSDKFPDNSRLPSNYKGCTALHVAIMCHALDVVIFLLERGADILAKSDDGSTSLTKSLDDKNRIYFRYFVPILKADEDLQARMEKETGITMLHIDCHLVDVDQVKICLDKGTNVNAQVNKDSSIWPGCTPLHILLLKELECISKHNAELHEKILIISGILLDGGIDVTLANVEGDTPLHILSRLDENLTRCLRLRQLMNYHSSFRINPVNAKGHSHFHLACMVNDMKAIRNFLQCDTNVNEPIDFFSDKYPGCSTLHLAIDGSRTSGLYKSTTQLEIVYLLFRYGADARAENSYGYTALHSAVREPEMRKEMLERIISAGANINSESIYGETPFEILLLAVETIEAEEIRFFIEHGARINSYNSNNDKGYLSMLLSEKHHVNQQTAAFEAMINAPDIIGVNEMDRTAIHNVVTTAKPNISAENYVQLFRRLATLGCDVGDQDKSGWTALHLAAQFGNREATVALLRSGVDVNVIDTSNKSAFSYATEICRKCDNNPSHRHTEVIQALALHIHKLQIFNLDVSQLNANLKKAMCPRIDVEDKFQEEVDAVKKLEIAQTSLVASDFLQEKVVFIYPYMSQRERDAIDEFFEFIDNSGIEQLKGILIMQYRKAVTRLRSIQPAMNALRHLMGFPLPDLCCERIFTFLKNADLKNLIASTSDIA